MDILGRHEAAPLRIILSTPESALCVLCEERESSDRFRRHTAVLLLAPSRGTLHPPVGKHLPETLLLARRCSRVKSLVEAGRARGGVVVGVDGEVSAQKRRG